ncbi:DNA-directed RNA polymerase subunit omega [Granulicatella sp. zg-84]|uniref:DNA-directed RNA polymerase subunit omega n=1 Tax=Granulicatella sp. zg-84 TaxID=2678503 RepID=UPI0013C16410|nr:DNA-directed RNA polymerase subunit omega [Granulicatella sp. zg-84]NEW65737.1 DNA-directed RNA polymerase subunit omega [Granulicatella sp. zg-84]
MMLYPSIDKLLDKIDSKYSLVIVSSKRAHELDRHEEGALEDYDSYKNVGRALEEVVAGELTIDPLTTPEEV